MYNYISVYYTYMYISIKLNKLNVALSRVSNTMRRKIDQLLLQTAPAGHRGHLQTIHKHVASLHCHGKVIIIILYVRVVACYASESLKFMEKLLIWGDHSYPPASFPNSLSETISASISAKNRTKGT